MPTDVLDLYAKVKFDSSEYKKGLADAESSFNKVGDAIKTGLGVLTKATAAAVGAGAAAVGKMVSDSVNAYGEYEQLVGGVQTLFGESAQKVLENSEKAFRTAGMSMNEYMETSIQSAASLINSLGGDQAKAAELMDMSITDMSDNVNKMGTTMEAVQNAYRGFSRQNFTMLDNLALGFAGTKEGMQELLDKAQQISGVSYDIESYSDIVQAIHVVQQEMGITGTTAAEAADTIQGSTGSMKAAWENLKVELVKGDGDIGKSIDILVNSALTAFDNIEPKIERALGGMSQFVGKAAPILAEKLPPIIEQIVPPLLTASSTLVYSVGKGIAKALPSLLGSIGSLATGVYSDFASSNLGAFDWIREDVVKIGNTVREALANVDTESLLEKVRNFGDSFNRLTETIGDQVTWVIENVINGGIEILPTILDGIAAGFDLTREAIEILQPWGEAVWDGWLHPLLEAGGGALDLTVQGLKAVADALDGVDWEGYWVDMFSGEFGADWQSGWNDLKNMISECGDAVDEFFDTNDYARSWNKFWQGVGGAVYSFTESIFKPFVVDPWKDFITDVKLGYEVISDVFDWIGEKINTISEAISGLTDGWTSFFEGIGGKIYDFMNPIDFDGFDLATRKYANGGSIYSGQAIIAEAGPELLSVRNGVATVTPLSVNSSNSAVGGMTVNVNLGGVTVASDYDVDRMSERMVKKLSERLADLSVRQQRAVGGTGWD